MHRRAFTAGAAATLMLARSARAAPARLVVAELFTSQGCSSCPPADALLSELADAAPDVLPLAFHVTYWDRLGWRDPFALEAATSRQRQYSALWHSDEVYTPQMVVDGMRGVVGSDRVAVRAALSAASSRPAQPVRLRREGNEAVIDVPQGVGSAAILLVGYDSRHRTAVGRGENGGHTLVESNIVRGLVPVGQCTGNALQTRWVLPPGERWAVLLQAAGGEIVGAAREDSLRIL